MANSAVYIIAEAGVNHNGDLHLAEQLIDVAAAAGADAVKFQTFNAEKLAAEQAQQAAYQRQNMQQQVSQRDMLKALELPLAWHQPLQQRAQRLGIDFLSTAFDSDSLQHLLALSITRIKVPSGELTNAPLLLAYARSGLPLMVSTGMAFLSEIEQALATLAWGANHSGLPQSSEVIWQYWCQPEAQQWVRQQITLLHCTSQYPAPDEAIHLAAMDQLAQAFGCAVGYSDHSAGIAVSVAAAARGARVIEKHFTVDRSLPGPDHQASIEADQLTQMVAMIRQVSSAIGQPRKLPQACEWDTRALARQVLVCAQALSAGQTIDAAHLTTCRSRAGMSPHRLWDLLGRPAQRDYAVGELIDE
ncbi:sialic acid synthase [Idiomarina xiamenensis 10-D-4]|uniref:Sialic acid synthase n=2 Tax=Idiomarina xiamenensis TaxID=1207041 RepID=K2JC20_9GAMM|nr:sialic acid synthase [Idiomarina xiamenensis 10-D-4]